MGRTIPGNGRVIQTVVYDADRHGLALAASLAIATAPFSPMAVGVHSPSTQAHGYSGVPGYGVNRQGQDVGPMQQFQGAVAPITDPAGRRLGLGAGVSGQPGMPSTGADATGLAYLGLGQLGNTGMGA